MTPRIRSFGAGAPPFTKVFKPEAPQVFREFVAQLEKLDRKRPKAKPAKAKAKSPRRARRRA